MINNSMEFNQYINKYADPLITFIAAGGVIFVAVSGLILSYESLLELATVSGAVNAELAWLWPLTLDALAIVASLNVLWAETRQEHDNYAWTLVIAFTLLSVIFNATHAGLESLLAMSPFAPVILAAFVGILPPTAAAFALHLVVRLFRRVIARAMVVTAVSEAQSKLSTLKTQMADLTTSVDTLSARRDQLNREISDLKARKKAVKRANADDSHPFISGDMDALNDANATRQASIDARRAALRELMKDKTLLRADIAKRLGVSERTIQRDIDALQPELNGHSKAMPAKDLT